ncbi:MAG: FAD-dependent oxidoreductase [Bacteroidetes bacterium]|nr:MAG: FAD-dependent oxidoreductase [Bacteroidota bacterium]
MNRDSAIQKIAKGDLKYDVVVIGGGASGLGAALEAASRGYKTLLLEKYDFAKGTSSRSTKLVHGGVRYLAQGNVSLVLEALRERGRLKRNAPHLVRDQGFIIPCYSWWCVPFYTIGLTLYDLMAGKLGIGRSIPLSKKRCMRELPHIKQKKLRGGVRYFDGQFDDARLAVNLAQTIVEQGGVVVNYMELTNLVKKDGKIAGVVARDVLGGESYEIRARTVINATGVFVDDILKMDEPEGRDIVKPSQGIHLVVDRKYLGGDQALMIPKTSDGRVLFAVPWHDHVVVGTTDVEKQQAEIEPHAEEVEINYILETARLYFDPPFKRDDVLAVYTGLRPLAAPASEGKKTKEISRGHKIIVSASGMVTITGGKWTTYRKMGEDVVDKAVKTAGLQPAASLTERLRIHGYKEEVDLNDPHYWYGSDQAGIQELILAEKALGETISEKLQIQKAQIIWAIREEMAMTLEDCLGRRIRSLQLDVEEALRIAPEVAHLMAVELGRDEAWEKQQLEDFSKVAKLNTL